MTQCEIRRRAVEIIEERGWSQGPGSNRHGEVCILQALCEAEKEQGEPGWWGSMRPDSVRAQAIAAMGFKVEVVEEKSYGGVYTIARATEAWEWNDAKGRTKDEVIARLKEGCEA